MTEAERQYELVTNALGYNDSQNLVTDIAVDNPGRRQVFAEARKHLGRRLKAVFFGGSQPLIYFVVADHIQRDERAKLFVQAWNDGRSPLLVCITATEVYIYNSTALPPRSPQDVDGDDSRLIKTLTIVADQLDVMAEFNRAHVESGATWISLKQGRKTRCTDTLLTNLQATREKLVDECGLSTKVVHLVLLRTILILYLEQRGILDLAFFNTRCPGIANAKDALNSRNDFFRLCEALASKFNGDLFPVSDDERTTLRDEHVQRLNQCLSGTENVRTGQMWLWPLYDFSVIPVHMVSSIYELFLSQMEHAEKAKQALKPGQRVKRKIRDEGEFYTPPFLSEIMLDEVLPWPEPGTPAQSRTTVLDPACGSGVFLVEAFRRLVARWVAAHSGSSPTVQELCDLLQSSIFGVDSNPDAAKVAAFSLYLCLLDYAEPKAILAELQLPKLTTGSRPNIESVSAFLSRFAEEDQPFDVVVGNPPWKRDKLPEGAETYLERFGYSVPKQMAAPFMWLAARLSRNGHAGLVLPSKWLFNRETPDVKLRRDFFRNVHVESVVNLSIFRRAKGSLSADLFSNAVGPAAVVIFRAFDEGQCDSEPVLYVTPKPSPLSTPAERITIRGSDLVWIPRQAAKYEDDLWKPLMWGSWRDVALVRRLRFGNESLGTYLKAEGMVLARGFQTGEVGRPEDSDTRYVDSLPRLSGTAILKAHLEPDALEVDWVRRPYKWTGPIAIYGEHHLLVNRGRRAGRIGAAFAEAACCFDDNIYGVSGGLGRTAILKALCLFVNSTLAQYLLFMMAGDWGVERERINEAELEALPVSFLRDDTAVSALSDLWDSGSHISFAEVLRNVDRTIEGIFGLSATESLLLEDFEGRQADSAAERPADDLNVVKPTQMERYATIFLSAAETWLRLTGIHLEPVLYPLPSTSCDTRLAVVEFRRRRTHAPIDAGRRMAQVSTELLRVLAMLDSKHQREGSIYYERNLRVFDDHSVFFVKPAYGFAWSARAAIHDADELIGDFATMSKERRRDAGES